jgi:hypothetical protein
MKALREILICLIIALASFAGEEKEYFSLTGHHAIENTANEEKSDKSTISDIDFSEVDAALTPHSYNFSLKYLPCEKVIVCDLIFTKNFYFHIWQPPKIA